MDSRLQNSTTEVTLPLLHTALQLASELGGTKRIHTCQEDRFGSTLMANKDLFFILSLSHLDVDQLYKNIRKSYADADVAASQLS